MRLNYIRNILLLFFVLFFSQHVSGKDIQSLDVLLREKVAQHQEAILDQRWVDAIRLLDAIEFYCEERDAFIGVYAEHYQAVASWVEQERIKIILHKDNQAFKNNYLSDFEKILSEFKEYNLWIEDPEAAWDYAKERILKNKNEAISEEGYKEGWRWNMKSFTDNIANKMKYEKMYEAIATPAQKITYYNGLADNLHQISHGDCRLSMPYYKKAWENLQLLSKSELFEYDDFGWGKQTTALKLFHCYQMLGDSENASSMYEKLKKEKIEAVYIPQSFKGALEHLTHEQAVDPNIGSKISNEFEFREGTFCRNNICYNFPDDVIGPSPPEIVLNHVFILGVDPKQESLALYIFKKESSQFIKKIILKNQSNNAIEEPPIVSLIDNKLIVGNYHEVEFVNLYDLRVKEYLNNVNFYFLYSHLAINFEKQYMHKMIWNNYFWERLFMQPSGRFPDIAGKKLVQMEGKYIPFFLKALGHSHYRVRQRAVEALGMLRDIAKEVVPQLINVALEDPAAYVKQAAIRALRKIGGTEEAISQFTNVLFGPDQSLRSAASNALLYIGANVRELVPQLVENLSKPDIQTRRIAASVLHRLGQQVAEDAIPQLIDAVFNDSDSLVYTDSIHALNKIGAEKVTKIVLPRFKSALSSLDVKVRQRAALAFCYMSKHVEGAALPLTELTEVALHDPDETTRRYASGALGNIAFFLPIESELLSSSDAKVRQRAAMALYYMGSRAKAAAPQLVEAMLNDTDATVRSSSAKALGLMWKGAPNDKIVNALVHALSDLDASVRWSAAQALSNAKDNAKEAIFHLTGALSDPDARVRDRAADALNKIGKEAVPYLLTELSNSDVGIRRRVAEAFFHIGAKAAGEAAPQLAAVLNSDSDVQVRFRIVCVLKEMPPNTIKGILNPLIEAGLRETDAEVSRVMSYIWKTLGRAEAREVLPKVMPALSDSDVLVCLNALGFLSFIGAHDKKVIPPLVAKLSDSDVLVRRRAASALWNFFQPLPRKDFNTAIEMVPQVPHLAAALSDSDQGVREYVALTLCSMGSNANEALPQLENAISHLPTDYIRDRVQSTVDFLKKERIRSTQ